MKRVLVVLMIKESFTRQDLKTRQIARLLYGLNVYLFFSLSSVHFDRVNTLFIDYLVWWLFYSIGFIYVVFQLKNQNNFCRIGLIINSSIL